MSLKKLAICVCVASLFATGLQADTIISVSFSDFGQEDAFTNTNSTFNVGQTGEAFVWIETTANINTLSVTTVNLSGSGVAQLTGAEVFNPNILSNGTDVGDRWDSTGLGTVAAGGVTISDLSGFSDGVGTEPGGSGSAEGRGILVSSTDVDQLSVPVATNADGSVSEQAFLFARIDFQALATGTVTIDPSGIFLDNGTILDATVQSATVTVVAQAVPEPAAGVLLSISALGLLRRRR